MSIQKAIEAGLRVRIQELREENKGLREQQRLWENELILANSILESIEEILKGKEVSDFALSFPVVRQVDDLKQAVAEGAEEETKRFSGDHFSHHIDKARE